MTRSRYTTAAPRALAGLAGGAALGAILVALCLMILWMREAPAAHSAVPVVVIFVGGVVLYGYYAFVAFLSGLFFLACPLWLGLHLLGRRTLWDAIALGVVLMVGASLLWLAPSMASTLSVPQGWESAVSAAPMGALGAIVGGAIWKIAYRKETPP